MNQELWAGKAQLIHRLSRDGVGYYYRAGEGTTAVVLIHGMGGSSHNWKLVLPLLPANIPLVAVDLPWCATSSRYRGPSGPDELVNTVANCVAEAWKGPIVIAAHSIGAFFAWRFRDQQQLPVTGLAMVSAQLFAVSDILKDLYSIRALPLRLSLADAVLRAVVPPDRLVRVALSRSPAARRVLLWPVINPALLTSADHVGDCFKGNGGMGALLMVNMARHIDLFAAAQASHIPASIVYGTKDPLLTRSDNDRIERLGNIRSIRKAEGARHFPIIETPGIVASAIIEQLGT